MEDDRVRGLIIEREGGREGGREGEEDWYKKLYGRL